MRCCVTDAPSKRENFQKIEVAVAAASCNLENEAELQVPHKHAVSSNFCCPLLIRKLGSRGINPFLEENRYWEVSSSFPSYWHNHYLRSSVTTAQPGLWLIFDGEGEGEQAVVNAKLSWRAGTGTAEGSRDGGCEEKGRLCIMQVWGVFGSQPLLQIKQDSLFLPWFLYQGILSST